MNSRSTSAYIDEPYVIMIRSGPVWKLEEGLGFIAETLQSRFDGEILTWSPEWGEMTCGRVRVLRFPMPYEKPVLGRIRYVFRVWKRAFRARVVLRRKLVITTYDPFQSGIIGLLIKWSLGATLICEINGVYDDPALYTEDGNRGKEQARRHRRLRFGSFILRHCDGIKLLFPEQLSAFNMSGGSPAIAVFHNIVDSERFQPEGREPEPRILLVGTPFAVKGVDLLLEAFGRLAPEFPRWELDIVGWQLEEPAQRLDLPRERVRFTGPLPPSEVASAMETASIFALPSRTEGMGRVLLEAAFMGRPRIGSRVGGIPSTIVDGEDGLLVEPGDVDDLVRALRALMSDAGLRKRMGEAARARACEAHDRDAYIRSYSTFISTVCQPS